MTFSPRFASSTRLDWPILGVFIKTQCTTEIQNHLDAVNAVLILANGSVPRITASMDYALTAFFALFPKRLANNIAFLLTSVPTAASLNFPDDVIPEVLKHAPKFLIDNPIALQKNYLMLRDRVDERTVKRIKESMKRAELAEQNALEMLVELFEWLDGLEPQSTTEIIAISKKSEDIEAKITAILSQRLPGDTKDAGMDELARLVDEYAGLSLSGCFLGPLEKKIRLLEQHCESMEQQGVSQESG